jgi:cytoskeletal protein CcmA (bactofilin family)
MQKLHVLLFFLISVFILFQESFATVQLRVFSRDEGLSDTVLARPRFYIQNFGTDPLSNFVCYYYFTTEQNKTPQLEDYYTPDALVALENLGSGNYRVKITFSGITIQPGQTLPNPEGEVIGLHYTDWSVWNKTNDFSNTGLATFTLNGNIPVFTASDTLIYGNIPGTITNPPQPPEVITGASQYAVLSREYTDLRDRVIVKGGNVGSGVYVEAGCNTIVNGSVYSTNSIFLRENAKIYGDVAVGEQLNKQNNVIITGTSRTHAQINIPYLSSFTIEYGSKDTIIPVSGTLDLLPGLYRNFQANANSTLILHPGIYSFNKFIIEPDVRIVCKIKNAERLAINVQTEIKFGDRVQMCFESGTAYPHSIKIRSAQETQLFIGNSQIYGDIISPNAEVHMYSDARVNGSIYGKKIVAEPGVIICSAPLLEDLSHSEWNMAPTFDPQVLDYKTFVSEAVTSIKITPSVRAGTTVTINGNSQENTVALANQETDISIQLNNSDQCGVTRYNLKVIRSPDYQIYVNDVSPCNSNAEDGNSWATAYKDLQYAINRAVKDGKEIWLAEGIYKPSQRIVSSDPRSASFLISPGVEIRGGFKGDETDTLPWGSTYNTILSGDISGDDALITSWPPAGNDLSRITDNV